MSALPFHILSYNLTRPGSSYWTLPKAGWIRSLHISLDNYFYFIDMDKYSLESVLRKGAELVKRKGIKCLVLIL